MITTDQFVCSRLVETGPFSGCWEALDKEGGETHYMKSYDKLKKDFNFIDYSIEVAMYTAMSHYALPKMIHYSEEKGMCFSVLEKPVTCSLFDRISSQGPLSEIECRNFLCSLCDVLYFLNTEVNFVKWHLSYETIFIYEDGTIALLYPTIFNQKSYFLNISEEAIQRCESPELIAQNKDDLNKFTEAEKIWFIGVVLYYAAVGRFPFDGDSPDSIRKAVLTDHPSYPDELSIELKVVLKKLLMKNPLFRPKLDQIYGFPFMSREVGDLSSRSMTRTHSTNDTFFMKNGSATFENDASSNSSALSCGSNGNNNSATAVNNSGVSNRVRSSSAYLFKKSFKVRSIKNTQKEFGKRKFGSVKSPSMDRISISSKWKGPMKFICDLSAF